PKRSVANDDATADGMVVANNTMRVAHTDRYNMNECPFLASTVVIVHRSGGVGFDPDQVEVEGVL
ncbi:MAG: hypothetical protein KDI22_14330, partial [Gammaproteobacteria bacterium]|nr:hypothetical protein [Gammaproteobacteria bacterium]